MPVPQRSWGYMAPGSLHKASAPKARCRVDLSVTENRTVTSWCMLTSQSTTADRLRVSSVGELSAITAMLTQGSLGLGWHPLRSLFWELIVKIEAGPS